MNNDEICSIKKILSNRLEHNRYCHVLSVADICIDLAEKYDVNKNKAYFAGLLHDYAKELSEDTLVKMAKKRDLITHSIELNSPGLLHGPVGAALVSEEFHISDKNILAAIENHTLGRPEMSALEMVVYIADIIEPGRKFPYADKLRTEIEKRVSLEECTLAVLKETVIYNLNRDKLIHPRTIDAINYFQNKKINSKQ